MILMLVAPLAGAALAPAFVDVPAQRRMLVGSFAAAALGGAAYGLLRTVSSSPVSWRGFTLDPWRGLLVCGALLSTVVAVARAERTSRAANAQSAVLAASAVMIVPLLVTTSHLLAAGLVAGTVGFGVAAFAAASEGGGMLRAARSVAVLAASDVLTLVALGTTLGNGTELPPHLSTTAAALLLAAALIRLGLAPAAGPASDAASADATTGALWHGPVRAQGFLLVVMAIGAGRSVAYAAAAAAALSIAIAAPVALRRSGGDADAASLPGIATGVAVLGFALGGPAATWGATLAAAAGFAAWAAWAAGEGWSDGARASLAALPAGGLLGGAALVVAAVLGAGTVRPWFLALALPALAGLLTAAPVVWRARRSESADAAAANPAAFLAGALGIAVSLALAALPVRAASGLGQPVATLLGSGRLLSAGGEPGVAEDLALLALAAAVVAFAAGPGRLGTGGPPGRRNASNRGSRNAGRRFRVLEWWAVAPGAPGRGSALATARATAEARRWAMAAALLFAGSLGLALRVYVVAAGRGFL